MHLSLPLKPLSVDIVSLYFCLLLGPTALACGPLSKKAFLLGGVEPSVKVFHYSDIFRVAESLSCISDPYPVYVVVVVVNFFVCLLVFLFHQCFLLYVLGIIIRDPLAVDDEH